MSLPKLKLSSKILILLTVLLLSFTLTVATASNPFKNYNEPSDAERIDQTRTVGSGSRSSCQSLLPKSSLILLIPETEIAHRTISSNPALYIFAEEALTVPLKFNLVIAEPHINNPIFQKNLLINKPGLLKIELPPSVQLEYDQIYLWRIGIPCSDNTAKLSQVLRGAIKRVPISKELAYKLSLAKTPLAQAQVYAESGIWYEAFDYAHSKDDSLDSGTYAQHLLHNVNISVDLALIPSTQNDERKY